MSNYVTYFFGDFWHFVGLMLLVWSVAALVSNMWANLCRTIALCVRKRFDETDNFKAKQEDDGEQSN